MFLAVLCVLILESFVTTGIAAAVGLFSVRNRMQKKTQGEAADWRAAMGIAIMATWFIGLLLATPCYTPYPRLVLPGVLAAWISAAVNIEFLLDTDGTNPLSQPPTRRGDTRAAMVFLALFVPIAWWCMPHEDLKTLPTDRRQVQMASRTIHDWIRTSEPRVIYVAGEPAMYFQLRAAGEEIVAAIQEVPTSPATIEGQPVPTFLIAGPHANSDPRFRGQMEAAKEHWRLVQSFPYEPSAIVWLDLHDPRKQNPASPAAEHAFHLYEFQP